MDKHTPGPWGFVMNYNWPFRQDVHVMAKGFGLIATVSVDGGLPHIAGKQRANASLIATAPELLEALDSVLQSLQTGVPETIGYGEHTKKAFSEGWNAALNAVYERASTARAALAKARGEA